MIRARFLLAMAAGLMSSAALAAEPAPRIVVPIMQQVLPDGTIRFSVPVRIGGGAAIAAMLDTGSSGLRVFTRSLDPARYQMTDLRRAYRFESGVVLQGPLAYAAVSVGGAATATPIMFQAVRSVACDMDHPACPAARLPFQSYGIGGDGIPNAGYQAILGLSPRPMPPDTAHDPLPALGAARWIVALPLPGAQAPGALILNPDPAELSGYTVTHPIAGAAIPNCPDRPLAQQASCPPMRLDSGDRLGVGPFYTYAVLFDAAAGEISVKRRQP